MQKRHLLLLLLVGLTTMTCNKSENENSEQDSSENLTTPLYVKINDFVWKGMNTYYLWQEEVPDLSDKRFNTQEDLYAFLDDYSNPSDLFSHLKYKEGVVDKWSFIHDDYEKLEKYFAGVRTSSGAVFKLYLTAEGSSNVYGIVRYIVPNTDAASKPINRGAVFNSVNGTLLTTSNYTELLYNSTSYTLNLGTYFYNTTTNTVEITPTGTDVTLNKAAYDVSPVYKVETFNVGANKVGYLMYNSFTSNYDKELNNAFLTFKNENINDLILDLRYNGGGSVRTAIYLAGMITGQFEDQLLTKEQWNSKWQEWLEKNHPDWLVNNFTNKMADGTLLNTLNLSRIIILTTGDTASASELIINGLSPYIDVVTIGTTTHGKYTGSITLYDSPNFTKENVNPDHKWVMQPIVFKAVNKLDEYEPNGFVPDISLPEDIANMGALGTETEPLTARAIDYIVTGRIINTRIPKPVLPSIKNPNKLETEMYIEKVLPLKKI